MRSRVSSKWLRTTAVILLFMTSVNALVAGLLYIIDPSGAKLGMTTDLLQHSPFSSYLIPGIVLFVVNGVGCLWAAISTLSKMKRYHRFVLLQGILLLGWIVMQVYMLQLFQPLHLIMLAIGITLVVLSLQLGKYTAA